MLKMQFLTLSNSIRLFLCFNVLNLSTLKLKVTNPLPLKIANNYE
jgi:hypothetical protein